MTADFNQFEWHKQMIRSKTLNATTKLVGAALFDYSDEHGRKVFPSKAKLATDTGLSKSTVHRSIQRLRDTGWIRLVAEGGFSDQYNRPNEWRLTFAPADEKTITANAGGGVTGDTPPVSPVLPGGCHQRYPPGVTGDTQTVHRTNHEQIIDNSPPAPHADADDDPTHRLALVRDDGPLGRCVYCHHQLVLSDVYSGDESTCNRCESDLVGSSFDSFSATADQAPPWR